MTAKRFFALVITVLVCAAVLSGMYRPAPAQQPEKKAAWSKWEYKIVKGDLEEKALTQLGEDGWELISSTGGQPYISRAVTIGRYDTTTTVKYTPVVIIFKRLK